MILTFYFFRQFINPFIFGVFLFLFVLLLDKLFDIIDLIFNKGVHILVVTKLFSLFIPTVLPLTLPMALLLACLVTFGRLSEENELTAVRSSGISLLKVLWLPAFFSLLVSLVLLPFNTHVAPWANRAFRSIYENIVQADPLINVEPRQIFSIKNIKILAEEVDKKSQRMRNVFVYQVPTDSASPPDRIFAHTGSLETSGDQLKLKLQGGQFQRYDRHNPNILTHTSFKSYQVAIPLKLGDKASSTRFRNFSSKELKNLIAEMKRKGLSTAPLEAEEGLRVAMAFAPLCLVIVGLPLATGLRRGGRTFGFGVTIVLIFLYYLLLILGLTLAEKGAAPAHAALWIGNTTCLGFGLFLIRRALRK